ncbi:CPBP family intramembrane glutamic endopeptidase [Lactiplantibacillus garii]|nr:CPBP family intramembrane glutamic endopeptidase [Lactiplantibacillus garii]
MRAIRLATSLWLTMVGLLILVSLLFNKLPGLATLSSLTSTGFEELILIIIVLFLNERYVHQTLRFRSNLSWTNQVSIVGPAVLIAGYAAFSSLFTSATATTTLTTLLVALLVSVFEEILFRGIIFKQSLPTVNPGINAILQAAAFSSILFSLTHLVNLTHQSWLLTGLQLLFTFVIGLLLCGLYQATNSLWWPIVIHALNDFFSFSQPTINIPFIHTTAAFQLLEIGIILALTGLVFRHLVTVTQR